MEFVDQTILCAKELILMDLAKVVTGDTLWLMDRVFYLYRRRTGFVLSKKTMYAELV